MDLCTHYATMHEYINNNIMRNCMKYDYEVLFEEGWLDTIGKGISDAWKTSSKWVSSNWKNIVKWIVKIFQEAVNWVLNRFSTNRETIHKASRGAMAYIKKLCNKAYQKINRGYQDHNNVLQKGKDNYSNGKVVSDLESDKETLSYWTYTLDMFSKDNDNNYNKTGTKSKDDKTSIRVDSINTAYSHLFKGMSPNFNMAIEKQYWNNVNSVTDPSNMDHVRKILNIIKDFYEDNIFTTDVSFYTNIGLLRTNVAKQLFYINQLFKLVKKAKEITEFKTESFDFDNNIFSCPNYNNYRMMFETQEEQVQQEEKKEDKKSEEPVEQSLEKKEKRSNEQKKLDSAITTALSKIQKIEDSLVSKIEKKISGTPFESISSAKCLGIANEYLNEKTNLLKEKISDIVSICKERQKSSSFDFTLEDFKETTIKTDLKELLGSDSIDVNDFIKDDNNKAKTGKDDDGNDFTKLNSGEIFEACGISKITTDLQNAVNLYNAFEQFFVKAYFYFETLWRTYEENK